MTQAFDTSTNVLMQLLSSAVRSLLLAGVTGLALSAFRVKATSLRLFAWTAVLYAALAMPLLGWILPPLSVSVPASFRPSAATGAALDSRSVAAPIVSASSKPLFSGNTKRTREATPIAQRAAAVRANAAEGKADLDPPDSRSIPWNTVAIGIYLAVGTLLLGRFVVGVVFTRRLVRASKTIRDRRVIEMLSSGAHASGIRSIPQVAESELISVPMTVGVLRPAILLPANWREWGGAKLSAVTAHEVSHVARRDALTQSLSLVHRAIFWFSPLAWWINLRLAALAEEASDEAALSGGADRHDYARTLLGFFEALHAAPGRVWWEGVAMAKAGPAEQRLERILNWKGTLGMNLKKSAMLAIIVLAIPVVYLAAATRPANSSLQAQAPVPTPPPAGAPVPPTASSALPPTPAAPIAGVVAGVPAPAAPVAAIAPFPPIAPIAALPPAAWGVQSKHSYHGRGYSYTYGDDDYERFVIVTGKSDSFTMSGSSEDARHAEKLKKQITGDFIWFERDEKSYIVRDQATIDRARQLWAPQEELGKRQEELGKQQEELGRQQEALGKKMEQVQIKVPDMTAELDRLKAKLQKLGSTATMEQLGDLQSEIGDLQSKIGEIQSQAGEQQGKLGEMQGELGEKQGKLGEQQGELGRQQGELAEKASREMKQLLDEAIKSGKAKPEEEIVKSPSL